MSLRPPLLLITLMVSISLVACGGSTDADTTSEAATTTAAETVENSTTAAPAPSSEASETTADGDSAPDTSTPATATTAPPAETPAASPIADLEEYPVLESTIDDLGALTPEIETDNPNTRVILYANADGRKVYKSIYVKRNNRLKIINIDGGGPPLYNDSI